MFNRTNTRFEKLRIKASSYLTEKNDEKSLKKVNQMLSINPLYKQELLDLAFSIELFGKAIELTLIHHAANSHMMLFMQKLLELGVSINLKAKGNGMTPLCFALIANDSIMVAKLLELGADISILDDDNLDLTRYIGAYDTLKLIIDKSSKNNIKNLFKSISVNDNFIREFSLQNNIDGINLLLAQDEFKENIDPIWALHYLIIASCDFPNNRTSYNSICDELRPRVKIITPFNLDTAEINVADMIAVNSFSNSILYEYFKPNLFRTKNGHYTSKDFAVQMCISRIAGFVKPAKFSFEFFRQINAQLIRYIKTKHHEEPKISDNDETQLRTIDGVLYRVPVSTQYRGIDKSHALQELLISMLRVRGLAKNCYKWVGGIPTKIASPMLQAGDFCTEDRVGIGLLHGKISHMFHILLCSYILETQLGHIKYYSDAGESMNVTIQDILNGLFTYRHPQHKYTLFKMIFDARLQGILSFSDPHALESILICQGNEIGCEVLARYMIDSFCKGILYLMEAHNSNRKNDAYTSVDAFVEDIANVKIHVFKHSTVVANFALDRARKKSAENIVVCGDDHLVVKKHYDVDPDFAPAPFTKMSQFTVR